MIAFIFANRGKLVRWEVLQFEQPNQGTCLELRRGSQHRSIHIGSRLVKHDPSIADVTESHKPNGETGVRIACFQLDSILFTVREPAVDLIGIWSTA